MPEIKEKDIARPTSGQTSKGVFKNRTRENTIAKQKRKDKRNLQKKEEQK